MLFMCVCVCFRITNGNTSNVRISLQGYMRSLISSFFIWSRLLQTHSQSYMVPSSVYGTEGSYVYMGLTRRNPHKHCIRPLHSLNGIINTLMLICLTSRFFTSISSCLIPLWKSFLFLFVSLNFFCYFCLFFWKSFLYVPVGLVTRPRSDWC